MGVTQLSEPVSVLREIRRHLLLEITVGEKSIGNAGEIRAWILGQYRKNPTVADTYQAILSVREDLLLSNAELPLLSESKQMLGELEDRPLPKFCFLSVNDGVETCGVLVQRERLESQSVLYVVTIFGLETGFEKVGRVEIKACRSDSGHFASILTPQGWLRYTIDHVERNASVSFALRCLAAYHRYKYVTLPTDALIRLPHRSPKPKHLDKLLVQAYRNEIECTKVVVPLVRVEPEDIDHALKFSNEDILQFIPLVSSWGEADIELVLYEKGGKFLVGDDYLLYLAYKALAFDRVPGVILGAFTQTDVEIVARGRSELLPPVVVSPLQSDRLAPVVNKQELLEEKLSPLVPPATSIERLTALYVHFCRLLNDKDTNEADLHKLIAENPELLDSHFASIFSEVKIGSFRADLVLKYDQLDKRIVLVELERHDDQIFTKSNKLREKVTHATMQVENWIREIRANAPKMPEWLDKSYTPEGVVVSHPHFHGQLIKQQLPALHTAQDSHSRASGEAVAGCKTPRCN